MKLKVKKWWPRVPCTGSPPPGWVPNDEYQVSIGETWGRSQTLTAVWLSPLTVWQVRCLSSHFVDVTAEPQKVCDLFKETQFVVQLGVRGSWPKVFQARLCLSCSLCLDALPLNPGITCSFLSFTCFLLRCHPFPFSITFYVFSS